MEVSPNISTFASDSLTWVDTDNIPYIATHTNLTDGVRYTDNTNSLNINSHFDADSFVASYDEAYIKDKYDMSLEELEDMLRIHYPEKLV